MRGSTQLVAARKVDAAKQLRRDAQRRGLGDRRVVERARERARREIERSQWRFVVAQHLVVGEPRKGDATQHAADNLDARPWFGGGGGR